MTVGNAFDVASSERSGPFYVRLQSLPVNATQKLIRDFFSDLIIPDGGISVHRNFSIVVFDNKKDAAVALSKDYELLDGKNVRISKAGHNFLKDVQRARVKEARKKLMFGPPEQMTLLKQKKRIRPTKVKDCSSVVASKRFCPDEIEFPATNHMASLLDIKVDELKFNNEARMESGLRLPDDEVDGIELKPNLLTKFVPEKQLCSQDKVHKPDESMLLLKSHIDKSKVNLNDEKNVESYSESCFRKKFNSEKKESRHLEENAFVQESTWRFLDEKVLKRKDEISFIDENHSEKVMLAGKVAGQAASSAFPKKVRDVTKKFPKKKTIKPTSVLSMNLFKMASEGTVF